MFATCGRMLQLFALFYLFTYPSVSGFYTQSIRISNKLHVSEVMQSTASPLTSDPKFINDQKNEMLLLQLQKSENVTQLVNNFVNFFDESFDNLLQERISALPTEAEKQVLGKIRYEINSARQRQLRNADQILRSILSAGGLKQMEAKLMYHLKRVEIGMPFLVILELNIEDAYRADSTVAVQVMTHLKTLITEYQDKSVSPPVLLTRLLVRIDDEAAHKSLMRRKLKIDPALRALHISDDVSTDCLTPGCSSSSPSSCSSGTVAASDGFQEGKQAMEALAAGQCEHIVIEPVAFTPLADSESHSHDHSHEHDHSHHPEEKFSDIDDDCVVAQELKDVLDDVIAQVNTYTLFVYSVANLTPFARCVSDLAVGPDGGRGRGPPGDARALRETQGTLNCSIFDFIVINLSCLLLFPLATWRQVGLREVLADFGVAEPLLGS